MSITLEISLHRCAKKCSIRYRVFVQLLGIPEGKLGGAGGGCVVVFITKYQISISLHLCTGKSFIQGGEESDTDNGTYFMVWKLWPQIKDVEDKTMENIDFHKMEKAKKLTKLCT